MIFSENRSHFSGSCFTKRPRFRPSRRRGREVDDAALHERAAIVDANNHRAVARHVRDAHVGPERQRWMRGGHGLRVHHFAVRGLASIAVMRRQSAEWRGIGTFKNAAREEGGGKRKDRSCASHVDSMVIAPARPMVLSCMVSVWNDSSESFVDELGRSAITMSRK